MRKTSSSLPYSSPGLSGSFFINTSFSGRAGCHPVTGRVFEGEGSSCLYCLVPEVGTYVVSLVFCRNPPRCTVGYTHVLRVLPVMSAGLCPQ